MIDLDGYSIAPCLSSAECLQLIRELEPLAPTSERERVGGVRNLLGRSEAVRELARAQSVRALIEPILGADAFAVRAILFDKTPGTNWKVIWHQDLTIAVRARHELRDFGPWSVKEGVICVQPPLPILERMLAIRIHLDDCAEENGPLRVIPGSHRLGRLGPSDGARVRIEAPERTLTAMRGDAILMRPLLLHASSPASSPSRRRVIHIELSAMALPSPLEWFERV